MRFSLLFLSTCALLLLNNGLHAQSNLHELVPYQGHELLDAPVSMDTIDVHKINLYCDWNTLEAMILDLEERIADALGEPVERDFYFSREVAGAKDYRMPDCYVLRDSVLSLQVQLDEALASEPGVMSLAVSDLAQRVATLHGRVFDDGNVPLEAWAFKFGLDSTLQDSVAVPFGDYAAFLATSDLDTGAFHLMLEDLDRYTTYFFTAVASNEEGAGYGDTLSFTTLPDLASGMVLSEENITANAALLRLTIADPGGQGPDSVEFFWGTTDHPSVTLFSSSAASDSIEGTDHSLQVTGLTRYTEYFYNAAADNLAGRAVVEANASFWTLPEPIQHDSIYYNSESGKIEALIADNGGQNIPDSYLLKKLVWDTLPTFPNAFEVPSNMYVFSANPNKQILKGTFSFDGREPGTYHYFNAWATNDVGTEYSDTLVVATPPATMTYNPGLPSSDWSPLELIVDSDCIWTEITPDGKFAVVNTHSSNELLVYEKIAGSWVLRDLVHQGPSGYLINFSISNDGNTIVLFDSWQSAKGAIIIYEWDPNANDYLETWSKIGSFQNNALGIINDLSADGNRIVYTDKPTWSGSSTNIYTITRDEWMGVDPSPTLVDAIQGKVCSIDGISLSDDGSTFIIQLFDYADNVSSFQHHFYGLNPTTEAFEPKGSPLAFSQNFGCFPSLSGDGNRFAISDIYYVPPGGGITGAVRIYDYNPNAADWEQFGDPIFGPVPSPSYFGEHVALSPDGLSFIAFDSQSDEAYSFSFNGSNWELTGTIESTTPTDHLLTIKKKFDYQGNYIGFIASTNVSSSQKQGDAYFAELLQHPATLPPTTTSIWLEGTSEFKNAVPNEVGFHWATSEESVTLNAAIATLEVDSFLYQVTGLNPGTRYYFRAYSSNEGGTTYGDILSIETEVDVTTAGASFVGDSIEMSGMAIYDSAPSAAGFVWGLLSDLSDGESVDSDVAATFSAKLGITPLNGGSTVYFAAFATNSSSQSFGSTESFVTPVHAATTGAMQQGFEQLDLNAVFSFTDSAPSEVGFHWSASSDMSNSTPEVSTLVGAEASVSIDISNYAVGDTIFYTAYAINVAGTFTSASSFHVINACVSPTMDGYAYDVVMIGDQCWFAENLQTTAYLDGSAIPLIVDNTEWSNNAEPARAALGNSSSNVAANGYLYNNYTIQDDRLLCPHGWRLPDNDDFTELLSNVSPDGAELWGSNNATGFSAKFGGQRLSSGPFASGEYIWSSTLGEIQGNTTNNMLKITTTTASIEPWYLANYGYSVRCILDSASAPEVITLPASDFGFGQATMNSSVQFNWEPITATGFEYGLQPDLSDGIEVAGDALFGAIRADYNSGSVETVYYSAFATNALGTTRGDTLMFVSTDCNSPTIDGYTYEVVQIGAQCWFAENLRTTVFTNGDAIPNANPYYTEMTNAYVKRGAGTAEEQDFYNSLGLFYRGYTAADERGICPTGWSVPQGSDWVVLANELGGYQSAGDALKSDTEWDGSNSSGFSAVPGGYMFSNNGVFYDLNRAYFYSRSLVSGGQFQEMSFVAEGQTNLSNTNLGLRGSALNVRCLKDTATVPVVTTLPADNFGYGSATMNSEVKFNWNAITAAGFKYGLQPDLSDGIEVPANDLVGSLSAIYNTGTPDVVYFAAFATNELGTTFGDTLQFVATNCISPTIQGHTYEVVQIGSNCWFAEDLQTTTFNDATLNDPTIPAAYNLELVTDAATWSTYNADPFPSVQRTAWSGNYYTTIEVNGTVRHLYNWETINRVCPTNWSAPESSDFQDAASALLGTFGAGEKMKRQATDADPWDGTNTSGFNGVPVGIRNGNDGAFSGQGTMVSYWTKSTQETAEGFGSVAWTLNTGDNSLNSSVENRENGHAIRCILIQ